jgi:hypothetical protein
MSRAGADPYAVLGVAEGVSDAELRRVYRALVKQHHPDHNGGSAESAARFARVQEAYSEVLRRRTVASDTGDASASAARKGAPGQGAHGQSAPGPPPAPAPNRGGDPDLDQRIRDMEQEIAVRGAEKLRRSRELAAQEAAARQRAAYEAVAAAARRRPTPEELGNYSTDDSFTKIVDDAAEKLSERLRSSESKRQFARRLADLFSDKP